MLTLARFLELLPQFSVVDATKITPKLPLVFAINNGFAGIEDDTVREYALALATADYILKNETNTSTLLNASSLTGNAASTGNPAGIKREKSYDDEIEYFDVNASQLLETDYAKQLEQLIDSIYPTASFGIAGSLYRCGCT